MAYDETCAHRQLPLNPWRTTKKTSLTICAPVRLSLYFPCAGFHVRLSFVLKAHLTSKKKRINKDAALLFPPNPYLEDFIFFLLFFLLLITFHQCKSKFHLTCLGRLNNKSKWIKEVILEKGKKSRLSEGFFLNCGL